MILERYSLMPFPDWAKKGTFAILDQGLFSGANLLVNILLARWLESAQYGAFSVAYSVFLLLSAVHSATLTEPLLVFGASKYAECFPKYLAILINGHWRITGVISFAIAIAAIAAWNLGLDILAQALLGLTIAAPCILFIWLVRRAFYSRLQPQWAAMGSILYMVLILVAIHWLYQMNILSPASALVVMGLVSLTVSLWLSAVLRPQWHFGGGIPTPQMVFADHWSYGTWATAITALIWISDPTFYYVFLPLWAGLGATATLQATMNLAMPLLQAMSALSFLLLSTFTRQFRTSNVSGFRRAVHQVLLVFWLGSLFYSVILLLYGNWLMKWVYGGRYEGSTHVLLLAGLLLFPAAANHVMISVLRAMKRLVRICQFYAISSVVTLTLGLWAMASWGVLGAMVGIFISSLTTAVAQGVYLHRLTSTSPIGEGCGSGRSF